DPQLIRQPRSARRPATRICPRGVIEFSHSSRFPSPQISQPLFRPVPKVACGKRGIRAVMAAHLMCGPAPRRRLDDRHIQRRRAGEIEPRDDHDQLARDGPERAARVPETLQMTEEMSPFFCEGTLALACTSDRAVEELVKHGRTPLRNPPILCLLLPAVRRFECT